MGLQKPTEWPCGAQAHKTTVHGGPNEYFLPKYTPSKSASYLSLVITSTIGFGAVWPKEVS